MKWAVGLREAGSLMNIYGKTELCYSYFTLVLDVLRHCVTRYIVGEFTMINTLFVLFYTSPK